MIPGHQFQTAVVWDGSLAIPLSSSPLHVSVGFGEPLHFVDRRGTGHPAVRRSLEEGRLPIAHIDTRHGHCAWHETVFAHLLGRKPGRACGRETTTCSSRRPASRSKTPARKPQRPASGCTSATPPSCGSGTRRRSARNWGLRWLTDSRDRWES
jgi:hypothetical protein